MPRKNSPLALSNPSTSANRTIRSIFVQRLCCSSLLLLPSKEDEKSDGESGESDGSSSSSSSDDSERREWRKKWTLVRTRKQGKRDGRKRYSPDGRGGGRVGAGRDVLRDRSGCGEQERDRVKELKRAEKEGREGSEQERKTRT